MLGFVFDHFGSLVQFSGMLNLMNTNSSDYLSDYFQTVVRESAGLLY